jgi:pentapeptide MXKDX repeat protein
MKMQTLTAALMCLTLAAGSVLAADDMMKKDTMGKDGMKKDTMSKDCMKKDAMDKDCMKKDSTKKY